MLYYLSSGDKMNFPSILFKYLREMIKEIRNGSNKIRNWIPLGRLISDILFESKLVHKLIETSMIKEVNLGIRKNFKGHNLKNMFFISSVVNPLESLDKASISSRRIPVVDYPLFSKEEFKEVLELYISDCLASGVDPGEYLMMNFQIIQLMCTL